MIHCRETAGFLFAHDCHRPSAGQCSDCAKQVCSMHQHTFAGDRLCSTCARAQMNAGSSQRRYGALSESPAFFAEARYPGFGTYPEGSWGHDLAQP